MIILDEMLSLLTIASKSEVLWITFPLVIATIVMLFYFEKYHNERPGWNTHVANSLVLLFVSAILLRYIFDLDGGLISYINYLDKFVLSLIILLGGIVILSLNFRHFLPEKIAIHVSSPLTLNLLAYVAILRVYSDLECNTISIISTIALLALLLVAFNLIKIPLRKLFTVLDKMKEEERKENIIQEKKPIQEKKINIKREEALIRKVKRDILKEEALWRKAELEELDKEKKKAVKLKKVVVKR